MTKKKAANKIVGLKDDIPKLKAILTALVQY
jgi:hypothetical protein